jgi:8-oxo-dGTP pyrophosphatase MutT (NUDIX family)
LEQERFRAQVAALPVRRGKAGTWQVLLITSRDTGRWIIPKGWPMKGRKDHQAAAREAHEEAGVVGKVHKHPVGGYSSQKRFADRTEPCRVLVYRLDVEKQLENWPEKGERSAAWVDVADAASRVIEPGLAAIIRRLNAPDDH